jgi:hypothetical protein
MAEGDISWNAINRLNFWKIPKLPNKPVGIVYLVYSEKKNSIM